MSRLDLVLLTTAEAAEQTGVRPATVRDWARRGLLTRSGGSPRRPLWRASDVLAAARAGKPRRAATDGGT